MDNEKTKVQYRAWAKNVRVKLGREKLEGISHEIVNKIRKLDKYKSSAHVMSYMAKDFEISLNDLFYDKDKFWYLPVIDKEKKQIIQVPYIPQKTKLKKNHFGIFEPEIIDDFSFEIRLDLILVPGLCFDKNGHRIGFGKGYYDSFLKSHKNVFKIGVCPNECIVNTLPVDERDIEVDIVISEGGVK